MNRYTIPSLACVSALALSACSNSNNSTPPFAGAFRLVNGVSDSNGITASASSGFPSTGTANFDTAGSTVNPPEGGYNVQLFAGGSSTPFFTVNSVSIDHNNLTTVFTYGTISGGTAKGFAAEENLGQPTSGNFTLQFVNDTTQATTASLNVYLVKPGSSITGVQPAAQAGAASASTAAAFAAGTYEIIVTNGVSTVYDSGKTQAGVVLPPVNTNVVQIGMLDATSSQASQYGGSPVTLLLMDNNGGETLHYNGQN
ncbi:MAG: hypothetical protein P4L83_08600 [Nevskia sp.]|nr:hypothetical protein [Nevskia sp.]